MDGWEIDGLIGGLDAELVGPNALYTDFTSTYPYQAPTHSLDEATETNPTYRPYTYPLGIGIVHGTTYRTDSQSHPRRCFAITDETGPSSSGPYLLQATFYYTHFVRIVSKKAVDDCIQIPNFWILYAGP